MTPQEQLIKLLHSYNPDLPMGEGMKAQFLALRDECDRPPVVIEKVGEPTLEPTREPAMRTAPPLESVARDVELFGVGFVVDGVRVSPDRVTVQYATRAAQTEQQPVAEAPAGKKVGELMMEVGFSGDKVSELVKFILDAVAEGGMTAECGEELGRHLEGLDVGEVSPDANVELNRKMLLDRSKVGLEKYGVTTERGDLTPAQWAQHAIEEALDFANYLQALKRNLEDVRELISSVVGQCESGFLPDGETMWALNEFLKLTDVQGKAS